MLSVPMNMVEPGFQIEIQSQMQFPLTNSYTFLEKLCHLD